MISARRFPVVLLVAPTLALAAAPAAAKPSDPVKCQITITKEVTKFFKSRTDTLRKCEENKVKDKHDNGCLDGGSEEGGEVAEKLTKASEKLHEAIAKSCGGDDKVCGTADDAENPFVLADIGFATCPAFEGQCGDTIDDCDEIADCVECITRRAADQMIDALYANLMPSDPKAEKNLNKCQVAIGKEAAAFALSKEKALGKCWDARHDGKHASTCPDALQDVKDPLKAAESIVKAEIKKIEKICKACGGDDDACDDGSMLINETTFLDGSGGNDDLDVAAITSTGTCPSLLLPEVPGRLQISCSRQLTTLADLVFCVDCVAEYNVDCLDRARVPAFEGFPGACEQGACPETELGDALPIGYSGSTMGAPTDFTGTCGGAGPERLFHWTPPANGRYKISTIDPSTNFNTVLYLRNQNCAGEELACNDNFPDAVLRSELNLVKAIGGEGLGIVVDGATAMADGNFLLYIQQLPAAGSCCTENVDNPGCDLTVCQDCVCAMEPSCCNVEWTQACADLAGDECALRCPTCAEAGTCGLSSDAEQLLCIAGTCHCPFTCETWNPAGLTCSGAPQNSCDRDLSNRGNACTVPP